jgi:predicted site-specific integrase-resolvase
MSGTDFYVLGNGKRCGEAWPVVLYARVSSADQRADLDRQVARLAAFAADKGVKVAKVVAEIGSGLNGHRKGLLAVLRTPEYGAIVVEHRGSLPCFHHPRPAPGARLLVAPSSWTDVAPVSPDA